MRRAAVFSGGGARCFAQLGFMDVLYERGIEFEAFSGSSGGAVAAALLAKGYTPKEALEAFEGIDFKKISFNLFNGTIFCHKKMKTELIKLGLDDFENLKKRLFVAVTEYEAPNTRYIRHGDLAQALLASTALLPLFCPVELEDGLYIDGGLSDNLPVTPVKDYEYILSINVNPLKVGFKRTLLGNFKRAGYIMLNANIKRSIPLSTEYVEIYETINYGILERKKFKEIFAIGQDYAKKRFLKEER